MNCKACDREPLKPLRTICDSCLASEMLKRGNATDCVYCGSIYTIANTGSGPICNACSYKHAPYFEPPVKALCSAKDNETTVAAGVPVHDFVDERGWMWRYDDREILDVW